MSRILPWQVPALRKFYHQNELDPLVFNGNIYYIKDVDDEEKLLIFRQSLESHLLKKSAVGFDLEWKVLFQPQFYQGPAAIMQICMENNCFIFQIIHTRIPTEVMTLLYSSEIKKVGVNIMNDVYKLERDYSELTEKICGIIDLMELAIEKLTGYSKGDKISLETLAAQVLEKNLNKNRSIRTSDWEKNPLTEQQLQYAALDAFASLRIYEELSIIPKKKKINTMHFSRPETKVNEDDEQNTLAKNNRIGSLNSCIVPGIPLQNLHLPIVQEIYKLFYHQKLQWEEISNIVQIPIESTQEFFLQSLCNGFEYDWSQLAISEDIEKTILQFVSNMNFNHTESSKNECSCVQFIYEQTQLIHSNVSLFVIKAILVHSWRKIYNSQNINGLASEINLVNENEPNGNSCSEQKTDNLNIFSLCNYVQLNKNILDTESNAEIKID